MYLDRSPVQAAVFGVWTDYYRLLLLTFLPWHFVSSFMLTNSFSYKRQSETLFSDFCRGADLLLWLLLTVKWTFGKVLLFNYENFSSKMCLHSSKISFFKLLISFGPYYIWFRILNSNCFKLFSIWCCIWWSLKFIYSSILILYFKSTSNPSINVHCIFLHFILPYNSWPIDINKEFSVLFSFSSFNLYILKPLSY